MLVIRVSCGTWRLSAHDMQGMMPMNERCTEDVGTLGLSEASSISYMPVRKALPCLWLLC